MQPEDYGIFVLFFGLYFFLASLHAALVTDPLMVIGAPQSGDAFRAYLSASRRLHAAFCLTAVLALAGGITTLRMAGFVDKGPLPLVVAFAAALLAMLSQSFLRAALFTRDRTWLVLCADLIFSVVQVSAILALAANDTLSNEIVFWAMAVAASMSCLTAPWVFLQSSNEPHRHVLSRNWALGKWLSGTYVADWVTQHGTLFITAGILGVAAPAALKACQNLLAPTHILLMGLDGVLTPAASRRFQRGGERELNSYLCRAGGVCIGLVALYGLTLAVSPEFHLHLLYGGAYSEHGHIVQIMAAQYTIFAIMKPFVIGMKVDGRSRRIFLAYLLIAVTSNLCLLVLLPSLGLTGAAFSIALGALSGCMLLITSYRIPSRPNTLTPGQRATVAPHVLE